MFYGEFPLLPKQSAFQNCLIDMHHGLSIEAMGAVSLMELSRALRGRLHHGAFHNCLNCLIDMHLCFCIEAKCAFI